MSDGVAGAALIAFVALIPLVVLMLTSFVKISVVLALLRNAIGSPDAPSGLIVMGISLVLTFFVMAPVGIDMVRAAAETVPPKPDGTPGTTPTTPGPAPKAPGTAPATPGTAPTTPTTPTTPGTAPTTPGTSPTTPGTAPTNPGTMSTPPGTAPTPPPVVASDAPIELDIEGTIRRAVPDKYKGQIDAADRALGPLRDFLVRHASPQDRETFIEVGERMGRITTGDELWILAPAFLTTELREAFAIAVLLFIPFLVIDLVVALALAALGLAATQPSTIALPLKLLLFVAVDGWRLLVDSLLRGYL